MEKKRLLIATDNFLPRWDGISRFLTEMIPRLKQKYEITIISPDYGEYKNIHNIKHIKIPLGRLKIGDFNFAKKPENIKEIVSNSEIIFVQTIGPIGKSVVKEGKKQRKKMVAFNHSVEWELAPKSIRFSFFQKIARMIAIRRAKSIYNMFDKLIAPSREIKDKFGWKNIKPSKKIIHLGVDTKCFFPVNKNEAKRKLGIDPKFKVIIYVGRLGREKDLKTLFRAFIRLRKDYENIRLIIVGDGVPEIRRMFESNKAVMVFGAKDDVVPYLQASDVYVLPSLTETTSLATLEAMACGVVPICTEVGLIKQYIKHGENGMTFTTRHVYMLTKRIEKVLNNPTLASTLSKNAIKTAKEFDWDKTAKEIISVFEGL